MPVVLSDMAWSTSLVVEKASGEQVIRPPRRTDAIGASLREAFAPGGGMPDDMAALLRQLERPQCGFGRSRLQ